jgi:P4 family phage/plasmid primase-like protien
MTTFTAVELRAIKGRDVLVGYYDDPVLLEQYAAQLNEDHYQIYSPINPISPEVVQNLNEPPQRGSALRESGVPHRLVLPYDVDADRPAGQSATEAERKIAYGVMQKIGMYWKAEGVAARCLDSGNGYQLFLPIDLPNTPESKALIEAVLDVHKEEFDVPGAHLDKWADANRILRIPGYMNWKGDGSTERPYRKVKLLREASGVATKEMLEKVAARRKSAKHNSKPTEVTDEEQGSYDLEILGNVLQLWSEQNSAFEFQEGRVQTGSGYWIRCPGEDGWPDGAIHSEPYKGLSSTVACWVTNGHPRWRCQHAHCGSKSWKDLVSALGPGAQRRVLTGSPLFGEARHTDRAATERFLAMDLSGRQAPLPRASENVDGDGVGAGAGSVLGDVQRALLLRTQQRPAPQDNRGTAGTEEPRDREAVGQGNPEAAPRTAPGPAETEDLATPRIRAFTDLGNTERFLDRHKDSFRFTSGKGWYSFDGTRWVPESDSAVMVAAWETVRAIGDEPEAPLPEGHRGRPPMSPRGWMRQSEAGARLAAIVSLVKNAPGIAVKEEAFDTYDWYFNCMNGTIDLKTGRLMPHDRNQLLSTISPVKFDPRAECPKWMEFLEKVMQGDQELVSFLQRLAGYTMSGSVAEQAFCVNWGEGSNGKSTYLDVLSTVMGGYADTTPFNTFSERKNGGIPNDLAALHKARMVICSEGARTTKLAEAMIKNVTGSETVSARFLHHEFFSFRPKFTLFLQSNHKPVITGTDHGIWRRVRFIPWLYTFSDAEINKRWAQEEVEAEGPGVLNWMIKGCLEYQRIGLAEPEVVRAAIAQYRENSDTLGIWLKDECTKVPGHETPSGGFYAVYRSWARDTGEDAITAQEFKTEMLKRGYGWKKTKKANVFVGIRAGIVEVQ